MDALIPVFLLFSFTELFQDMNLVLKIFALLTVISFVYSHLGKGPLSIALIGGLFVFVILDYWKFFGGVFVLYSLLTLGISGILIDFFFVSQMGGGEEVKPVDSAMDIMMRNKQLARAHAMQGGGGMPAKAFMGRGAMPPGGGAGGGQPRRPMGR